MCEPLSFIDPNDGPRCSRRFGRSGAEGALRDLPLPVPAASRSRATTSGATRSTGELTRRSEWFVPRTPQVTVGTHARRLPDLGGAAALHRSVGCARSRKARLLRRRRAVAGQARYDRPRAVSHRSGRRRHPPARQRRRRAVQRSATARRSIVDVATFVKAYLRTQSGPGRLRVPRATTSPASRARYGQVVATTFRNVPVVSRRSISIRLPSSRTGRRRAEIVRLRRVSQPRLYTQQDVVVREFSARGTRRFPAQRLVRLRPAHGRYSISDPLRFEEPVRPVLRVQGSPRGQPRSCSARG